MSHGASLAQVQALGMREVSANRQSEVHGVRIGFGAVRVPLQQCWAEAFRRLSWLGEASAEARAGGWRFPA
eukprot:13435733-Alexandrium_andersonii.AAC.1